MKTKSKKATKAKVSAEKHEKTTPAARAIAVVPEILTASEPTTYATRTTSDAAPIEVIQEVPVVQTAEVAPRARISADERRRLISLAAYHRAQRIGFGKTNPIEDWLLAEKEVDAMIMGGEAH